MKKYLFTFSILLNIVFTILCFNFYKSFKVIYDKTEVNTVLSKHNQISNDVAINIIFGKIDSNFNLIIMTVTILFGLFSFLTFFSVKEKFRVTIKTLKQKSRDSETTWAEHKTDLLGVKGDLSFEIADKLSRDLDTMFENNSQTYKDFVNIVELTLTCCDYYAQSLIFKKDVYPKFKASVTSLIKNHLSKTAHLISTSSQFELNALGYERFLRIQDNIHKVADLEDRQNLASIFSKLSFPTLD
jgi:hypothetical protein